MVDKAPIATERLREYWLKRIPWGQPHDFDMCVHEVNKYMTTEQAKGYCANLHHRATGMWPNQKGRP